MPRSASHVSTERILTRWMPASSTAFTLASSKISASSQMISSVPGRYTGSSAVRPRMRSPSRSMTSPASTNASISMPWMVPQSRSVMTASWATSTRRRVRYPEFAVLSAVSARPLRAPCVEMKYCNTVRPSRKLVVIGLSMISPDGLAINPRMPDS